MFATIPSPPSIAQNLYFAPSPSPSPSPAPLSTHNVNVPPRRSSKMTPMPMSKPNQQHPSCPQTPTPKHHHQQQQQQQQHSFSSPIFQTTTTTPTTFPSPSRSSPPQPSFSSSAYATRYARTIHNPASRIAHHALSRSNRRNQFLSRIQGARDESAFDARAERMLGVQCVSERRAFLERMERMAPVWGGEVVEEEEEEAEGRSGSGNGERGMMGGEERGYVGGDEAALEEFLSEEQKFQAFVEQIQQMQGQEQTRNMTYDDDDYDNLFANLASYVDGGRVDSHDVMDTSHG